jgi:3-oxoadipate enol-lactonase
VGGGLRVSRLFFIHGAGCTADVFKDQLSEFAGASAAVLPGHDAAAPATAATIAEFADAVAGQLRDRRARDTVLCGSSMGGAVALELALREEPAVGAVVLIGSGAKLRVAPGVFDALENDFEAAARWLAKQFFADPTVKRVEAAVASMLRVGQAQTLLDFRACDAFDATERIGSLTVPLLALVGEHDTLTPPKFSQWLAGRVPAGTARILQGAGHLAMIERPAETNAALREFVDALGND